MQHNVPDGDLATIIEEAITEKIERLEARKLGKSKKPLQTVENSSADPKSRYIPAAVRRAVSERDGNRCTFTIENGKRCDERAGLEFHHVHPFAREGQHSPDNIRLLCRVHNAREAEKDYGTEHMNRYRSKARELPALYIACGGLCNTSTRSYLAATPGCGHSIRGGAP